MDSSALWAPFRWVYKATVRSGETAIKQADGKADLLFETAETIWNMVEIVRNNEMDEGKKIFYSHVGVYCLGIRNRASPASQTSSPLDEEEIRWALRVLGSLLMETGIPNEQAFDVTLESRLRVLNRDWNETRNPHNDTFQLKLISQWMKREVSEDQQTEIGKAIGRVFDDLVWKAPEKDIKEPVSKRNSHDAGEPPHDVWKAAKLAFDALVKCKGCSCHCNQEFGAKIELGTYRTSKVSQLQPQAKRLRGHDTPAEGHTFEIFLSMEQSWHHVRVQTSIKRLVRVDNTDDVPSNRPDGTCKFQKVDKLCLPLSRSRDTRCLLWKLTNGHLFHHDITRSHFRLKKTAKLISLADYLETRPEVFTEKVKRILSLILSYAVFHLNDTRWLQPGWGSADVQFYGKGFGKGSCETSLRPFIRTQLPEPSLAGATPELQAEDDGYDAEDAKHCCPALVALAIVLMEVQFTRPFKSIAKMHRVPLIETYDGHITFLDAFQVFNGTGEEMAGNGLRSEIPDNSPLICAIDNCLNSSLWEDSEGAALDNVTLRGSVYQYVVQPLEEHLTMGFSHIPLDDVDKSAESLDLDNWCQDMASYESTGHATMLSVEPYHNPPPPPNMHSAGAYQMQDLYHIPSTVYGYKESQFFDDEKSSGGVSDTHTEKYRNWKTEYRKVYEKFITKYLPDPTSPPLIQPVKVAILDTGIDRGHYYIEAHEENLKGRFNCYNEAQKRNVQDRNGHGTFTTSLVLAYAQDAEIYIVKVADRENTRPDAKIVANAISHAVDEWGVDIISMSFGWPSSNFEGHSVLEAAIDKAYGKKVLMFAAASNSGGRLGRAYPASSTHVICVHSTNTNGTRSDFSPTAAPNAISIATIGESVESAWPVLLCGKDESNPKFVQSRSGTSYATPILAGIAAFLLHYARLHLDKESADRLKRKDGMEALLKRCAERGPNYSPRDGYLFVELSLNSHNLFGNSLEEVNYEIKKALKT